MNPCKLGTDYLNQRLSEDAAQLFEAHLNSCAACREEVYEWQTFARSLKKWAARKRFKSPTLSEARQLMERAEHRALSLSRPLILVAASGVAAMVFVMLWMWFHKTDAPPETLENTPLPIAHPGLIRGALPGRARRASAARPPHGLASRAIARRRIPLFAW